MPFNTEGSNRRLIFGKRGTGRTTKLIETAIEWLGDNDGDVYIIGHHTPWTKTVVRSFQFSGLNDLHILTVHEVERGGLRGMRNGLLCIDDFDKLPLTQGHYILESAEAQGMDIAYVMEDHGAS